jgi:hypothetical protein
MSKVNALCQYDNVFSAVLLEQGVQVDSSYTLKFSETLVYPLVKVLLIWKT